MSKLLLSFIFLLSLGLTAGTLSAQGKKVDPAKIPCDQLQDHPDFIANDALPQQVRKVPASLETALTDLDRLLNPYQKRFILCHSEEEVRQVLHHSLGTWVRNIWGLWDASDLRYHFLDRGVLHPDDMSAIILLSYHRKLRDQPLRIDEQIRYYRTYWINQGVDIDERLESARKKN
jgi:hypothetical protein